MMLLRVCDVCVEARPEVWTISASKACSQFLLGKKNLSTLHSVDLASAGESTVWSFLSCLYHYHCWTSTMGAQALYS